MGKPSAPEQPDYASLAKQQGQENRDTALFNAQLNRVNQVTPYGSSTWNYTPAAGSAVAGGLTALPAPAPVAQPTPTGGSASYSGHYNGSGATPVNFGQPVASATAPAATAQAASGGGGAGQWTQTTTLSPEQQAIFDQQNAVKSGMATAATSLLPQVQANAASPMDLSKLSALGSVDQSTLSGIFSRAGNAAPAAAAPNAFYNAAYGRPQYSGGVAQGSGSFSPGGTRTATSVTPASSTSSAGGPIRTTFDQSGVTQALPGQVDDTSRRRVEEALMARLNPQYAQDEASMRSRLLNSGIEVGTDAYNREASNFSQRLNDARMQAVLAGGQEETRQTTLQQGLNAQQFAQALSTGKFGQDAETAMAGNQTARDIGAGHDSAQVTSAGISADASRYGADASSGASRYATDASRATSEANAYLRSMELNNATRGQGFAEASYLQNQPLNQLSALLGGSQVSQPQFQPVASATAGAAPVLDSAMAGQGAANSAYQTQQSGYNGLMGGLATLGSAAIPFFSDTRLKTNIQYLNQHPSGVGRYSWDWRDGSGSSSGVLAQELLEVHPEAVAMQPNGYYAVNYDMIGGK